MDYREAGVDIKAGRTFVEQIRPMVQRTHRSEVLGGLGGFNGLFQLPQGYQEPILVSGTDGVGTKLKLAHSLNHHHTVGIDLVAMCVNDVLTSGAEPLFFLDYLATSQLQIEQLTQVMSGITQGCYLSGCALLGGETAEMPGFYQPGEYDLAGFCVGIVEKSKLLNGSQVKIGDVVIGLASQGVHSNGFSLIRKIIDNQGFNMGSSTDAYGRSLSGSTEPPSQAQAEGLTEVRTVTERTQPNSFGWSNSPLETLHERLEILDGQSLEEVLMTPTRIYVKPILAASQAAIFEIHGMAHITGGGLPENIPRCLRPDQSVQVNSRQWLIPPIFKWIAEAGEVSSPEMFNTFNMGIGFVLLVPPSQADSAIKWFAEQEIAAYSIGEVIPGKGEVIGLP